MKKLEDIGFYTLSDERAKNMSPTSPMWRCELIITDRCNFRCQYCRGLEPDLCGDMPLDDATRIIQMWCEDGLKNIRFSGGEPTLHPDLPSMIEFAQKNMVERIAISTNGSADFAYYEYLCSLGVNDISISLDACCAADADKMAGTMGFFDEAIENIKRLSEKIYVTVGIVINKTNVTEFSKIVNFAHSLGVNDIRIITAAQNNELHLDYSNITTEELHSHPILAYRVLNLMTGRNIRGLEPGITRCYLVQDDSAVAGSWHFPCIIYLREGGDPIGIVNKDMRKERVKWSIEHNVQEDEICKKNCLDVCRDINMKCAEN